MSFELVKLAVKPHICAHQLAVTVTKNRVIFRLNSDLATECKAARGKLFAVAYDAEARLMAIVEDPDNKCGYAAKAISDVKVNSARVSLDFPRVDLLARVFPEVSPIGGLKLFEKRGPGKIVFWIPEAKQGGQTA